MCRSVSEEVPCRLTSSAVASARANIRPRRTVSAPAASGRWSRSTTGTRSRGSSRASRSRPGRGRSGATAALLPAEPPEDAASGPGLHAARAGAAAGAALGVGEVLPQARPREPDALVQGPRRRGRGREGARVRARHALGHVDRQPRERRRRARGGDRHDARSSSARPGSSPRSSRRRPSTARRSTASAVSYDDCSRPRERVRRRGRLGDRQREPALVLRRGLEDARVRDRRAARLGDARRGRDADRLRRDVHEGLARASSSSSGSGLIDGRAAEAVRRPGRGLRARRGRVRRGAARVAGAAGHDRRRRSRSATRPTATSRSRRRGRPAARSTRCPRTRSAPTSRCSPRTAASSARARPASRSARCARRCARGELGESDRVVVLVTGTGLKTPQLSSEASGRIVEIDADVDALLEELGVTA